MSTTPSGMSAEQRLAWESAAAGPLSRSSTRRARRHWRALGIAGFVAAIGALAAINPAWAFIILASAFAASLALVFRHQLPRLFLISLAAILIGYAFAGRSFSYVGHSPVFIGEIVLVLGVLAVVAAGCVSAVTRLPLFGLFVGLWVWGVVCTVPHLQTYRADALRDAAIWGYSLFALLLAATVLQTRTLQPFLRGYGRWLVVYAAWIPVGAYLQTRWAGAIPDLPTTGLPLFTIKLGDVGVHLAGAAIFVLCGVGQSPAGQGQSSRLRLAVFWSCWAAGMVFVAAVNRGGFVALLAGLAVVGALHPTIRRRVLGGVAFGVMLLILAVLIQDSSSIDTDERRPLSATGIGQNLLSIVGLEPRSHRLRGTREWRLDWWGHIVEYTFFGPYFWSGKGFGINLAFDDGFGRPGTRERPNRSPHNGHLTMLARAGVPGVTLWLILQASFGIAMFRAYLRARRTGLDQFARVHLWILGYWAAFVVNASFDAFLESPYGGIWFWSVVGLGLAALRLHRLAESPARRPASPWHQRVRATALAGRP